MSFLSALTHRIREQEWMDAPGADPVQLRKSLAFIRFINKYLGYTRATLSHLDQFSRRWKPTEPIRILDIATGSADVPLALLARAKSRNIPLHVTGVDLHPKTAAEAQAAAGKDLSIIRADATNLPFADNSFDYAMTSMFLHHLDEDQIVQVMKEMSRVAKRGVLIADLLRTRRALFWINLFTLFANRMVRHDAIVSVRQAFQEHEILALRDRAGISFAKFHYHFAHRFVLAGEKS
jgi:ubiquinone/menaquinone biosynthesis C-methylase UbiE